MEIYYLNKFVDPNCDPMFPENMLVMATVPLTGTETPAGEHCRVLTRSPLTGAITYSNSVGIFPTEFKLDGFDASVLKT